MTRRIVTEFVYPPIHSQEWDWSAVEDGYEPGDPIGRGLRVPLEVLDLVAPRLEAFGIVPGSGDDLRLGRCGAGGETQRAHDGGAEHETT